jgi:microcystin-dependent protein
MINFIRAILTSFCLLAQLNFAFAQSAALLPNGVQQFSDKNGNPLVQGQVYTYYAGTSTPKITWIDPNEITPNTNPIILNVAGQAIIYGQGTYTETVYDRNGNLMWTALTSPSGSGGGGAATGDGDLVGTIKPWAGIAAPNQYAFAYGQTLSRSTYSILFTAITQTQNVNCTMSSNVLSGIADTSQIATGAPVEVNCVSPGTTVVSKTSSTVTVSNPSSVNITASATFFPFGDGDGVTTFNLPDLRGYTIAGRDNMGNTAAARLTSTYFGNSPDAQGGVGGSQSATLTTAQLPTSIGSASSVVTDPGHQHTITPSAAQVVTTGATSGGNTVISNASGITHTATATTGITVATTLSNAGGGNAHSIIQPTITLNYIIKITPDTNSSISTGVTSLGGMTGDIACGAGIMCTGNVISTTLTGLNTTINGVVCALNGSCTITATATSVTPGSTSVVGGVNNELFYEASGLLSQLTTANNSVLVTNGSGVPSFSTTLPSGTAVSNVALNGTPTGAGSSITVNSTTCSLSSSCTIAAVLTIGSSTISGGTTNGLLYDSSGVVGNLATGNNGTLITSGGGVPSISSTLPTAVQANITGTGTLTSGATGSGFTLALATSTLSGNLPLANGGSNAALTASNGGVVYSTASAMAILAGTVTAGQCLLSGSSAAPTWGSCTGAAAVSSVSNGDGTLTITPTTGAVVASLALGNANTWTAAQTFTNGDFLLKGSSSGSMTLKAPAVASTFVMTFPGATDTVAVLGTAQTFTAANTFTNSDIKLLGSSTGLTTFTSLNAGASNFTISIPAVTDTLAVLGTNQTFTGTQTFSGTLNVSGTFQSSGNTMTFPGSAGTLAALNIADQTLSGGANVTSQSQSTGNITVDCGSRPLQYITASTSAWTITAPSNDGACSLLVTNPGGSPGGTITFSGFTVGSNTGDTYVTTVSDKFILNVVRINSVSTYTWKALQ